jgi:hypothetical protein
MEGDEANGLLELMGEWGPVSQARRVGAKQLAYRCDKMEGSRNRERRGGKMIINSSGTGRR